MSKRATSTTPRARTTKGTYRQIRSDTRVDTIEKRYGVDLGARSDKQIGNYLREKGYPSLSRMLRDKK